RASHPSHGHKYEVRVVVYRDGANLRAMPSIAKISSLGYDADRPSRLSLINNITTSAEAKHREGTDFMLPLCHSETLDLLEISVEQMEAVCAYCTGFVRHILDQTQQNPERLGLPADERQSAPNVVNGQSLDGLDSPVGSGHKPEAAAKTAFAGASG